MQINESIDLPGELEDRERLESPEEIKEFESWLDGLEICGKCKLVARGILTADGHCRMCGEKGE